MSILSFGLNWFFKMCCRSAHVVHDVSQEQSGPDPNPQVTLLRIDEAETLRRVSVLLDRSVQMECEEKRLESGRSRVKREVAPQLWTRTLNNREEPRFPGGILHFSSQGIILCSFIRSCYSSLTHVNQPWPAVIVLFCRWPGSFCFLSAVFLNKYCNRKMWAGSTSCISAAGRVHLPVQTSRALKLMSGVLNLPNWALNRI